MSTSTPNLSDLKSSSTNSAIKNKPNNPIVLTIAGSDSGGGAGIQADIKAISATGSYACSVITAITAQNTLGVTGIFPIPIEFIAKQLDAVFTDLNIVAVKVGMLASSDIIELVAQKLSQYQPKYLVIDPVMIATSGDVLLPQSAINSLINKLFPMADIITPNLPEAKVLAHSFEVDNFEVNSLVVDSFEADSSVTNQSLINDSTILIEDQKSLIEALKKIKTKSILLKGGHNTDDPNSTDLLISSTGIIKFESPRIDTKNTHGTGCTLSAAIASYLAQGYELEIAVGFAKQYISKAIMHADELNVGKGHGPVNHFFE